MKKILIAAILTVSAILFACGALLFSGAPKTRSEYLLGTLCTIKIYNSRDSGILNRVFERIAELESAISINAEGTEVDKINEKAGVAPVTVSADVYSVVKGGMEYSRKSGGSFDISVGPIVRLWNIGFPNARVPSRSEIDVALQYVNYNDIEVNDEHMTVFLRREGMLLDLGAIAKGYIADEVVRLLKENNISSALVDLGGNVYVLGKNAKGLLWSIGVQDPFDKRNEIVGIIKAENQSLVTSGIYERYIERDGKMYHHILSPFNGYPFDNEIAGVTVISSMSIDGDGLSTTLFSKGLESGLAFIEEIDGVEALFITKDKDIYVTSGLKERFELTNEEYTLK